MKHSTSATGRRRGHPCGGLFVTALMNALVGVCVTSCGSAAPGSAVSAKAAPQREGLPDALKLYSELDFITGDALFPVVGRFAFLPGPADSTYAILAVSLPNSALRFRRETSGFSARYHVEVVVGDSAAPRARLSETQVVRVRSFRETSRRDESVVFQGFLKLQPGSYPAAVRITDLGSTAHLSRELILSVPRFEPTAVSAPLLVYRAEPRANREIRPSLIINPRATVELGRADVLAYQEWLSDSASYIQLLDGDHDVWTDTAPVRPSDPLQATLLTLDRSHLTPGMFTLRAGVLGSASSDSATLVVALLADWVLRDFEEVMSYLRYAATAAQLDSLRSALPGERARLLQALWKRRDPDPGTSENEFFERYFRRIRDANDRFGESATPGWLTDRGAVYVTLGPPDEVLREIELRGDAERSQVWLYGKTLGFDLRLVFVDRSGFGTFNLTADSRGAFRRATETIYS